ncbi:MAG UNVERIFIED_CONTAM: hypothetical protein LVR29_30240 [Microcystis novacekii LVE1205-3]
MTNLTLPNQRIYTPDDGLNWLMARFSCKLPTEIIMNELVTLAIPI